MNDQLLTEHERSELASFGIEPFSPLALRCIGSGVTLVILVNLLSLSCSMFQIWLDYELFRLQWIKWLFCLSTMNHIFTPLFSVMLLRFVCSVVVNLLLNNYTTQAYVFTFMGMFILPAAAYLLTIIPVVFVMKRFKWCLVRKKHPDSRDFIKSGKYWLYLLLPILVVTFFVVILKYVPQVLFYSIDYTSDYLANIRSTISYLSYLGYSFLCTGIILVGVTQLRFMIRYRGSRLKDILNRHS
jgi:hypothetical protein